MAKTISYTNLARVIAAFALLIGVLRVLLGIAVETGMLNEPEAGRYLGSMSSGEAIDQGVYYIVAAAIIGVLAEISQSISCGKEVDE